MVDSIKWIFSRKIIAFCVILSMIIGMLTVSSGVAEAAMTVKTIHELSRGDKVRFTGMKGDLDSTWTYCGWNIFESDKSIGNMSADAARSALINLDKNIPDGLKGYLVDDPFGGWIPEFTTVHSEFWNYSGCPEAYTRNGVTITEEQFYYYSNGEKAGIYLTMLPVPDYHEFDAEYTTSNRFNCEDGITYPARKALTSSAAEHNFALEIGGKLQFMENYCTVYRNADGSFSRMSSGNAPVYPAIEFNGSGSSGLYFSLVDGVYTQVSRGSFTFDANGGSGSQNNLVYYYGTGQSVELPTETVFDAPRGKVFKGWAKTPDADEVITEIVPESSSTVLYAIWEPALVYEMIDGKKVLTYVLPEYRDDPYIDPDTDVIASGAFDNCVNIKNVTIPYNVSEIEEGAFQNIFATTDNPVTITIKNPDCRVYYKSFRPQVTRIVSLAGSQADKLAREYDDLDAVSITLVDNTFLSGEIVRIFKCPDGVEAIGGPDDDPGVFEGHLELMDLDLGKVKTIGARAFKDCSFVTGTLIIPSTVEEVGALAFQHIGVDKVIIESTKIDPAKVAATGTDDVGISFEVKPPSAGGGGGNGSESGTGSGSGSGSHSSGSGSGSSSGYSGGGSGYSGGNSSGGSSSSGSGGVSSEVAPTAKPEDKPIANPLPTSLPSSGSSVSVVNDPAVEEEIIPPVIIEKIVTDISNISDAVELNGIKVKRIIREGNKLTVRIKKKKGLKYQIRYTTKKKSWKGALKKRFSKAKVSIYDLRYGKKYYFSIRAYKVVDGKKIYGKWSKRRMVR